MLNQQIQINYRVTFSAAFHLGTGLRSGLIHRSVATDPNGYLFVPGSTVKGVLRDYCGQIVRLFNFPDDDPHAANIGEANSQGTIIEHIFGSRFRPGRLYFDDAKLDIEDQKLFEPTYDDPQLQNRRRSEFRSWQIEKRTQVSLWRPTNTATTGQLYHSEYGIRGLRFDGQIIGLLEGYGTLAEPLVSYSLVLLLAGLYRLERIGGNKSGGAGQLTCEVHRLVVDGQATEPGYVLGYLKDFDYELYDLVVQEALS